MNRVKRGAFLTMDSLEGFICSDHLTYAPLTKLYLSPETPAVIEVELIEPSLYFAFDERSPDRFAHALDSLYRTH